MRKLRFAGGELRRVLCVGAHCDDIEIGCGATMLRLLRENPALQVSWVVLSSTAQRRREALLSAKLFLGEAKGKRIQIRNFRDSYFPYQGGKIKDYINTLKAEPAPDLIFTHWRGDLHQDHRLVSELTWNAFRDHLICEYEIPKYDGDLGHPNLFVEVSGALMSQKLEYIFRAFKSQTSKRWFTEDTFRGLMRIRGVESGATSKFAEAFHCRKVLF